ncbi:response regulator, partial [Oxalobacteraceae bacterium R-40]|nr:response regulator [Oxalobacteraceae bacterium R-40]
HGGRLDPGVQLISKPYRREDLARKIRHMLANAKPIVLPEKALSDEREVKHKINASALSLTPLQILVVEDSKDMLEILCKQLIRLGHDAKGVGSAEAAMQELNARRFDVLLTDVNLPGMSGVELARKACDGAPGIKIVISSGYGSFSLEELQLEAVFLPKPYNFEALTMVFADISAAKSLASEAALDAIET